MNNKLLKDKIILVERDFKIIGSNTSNEPLYSVISLLDRSISDFKNRKICNYWFLFEIKKAFLSSDNKNI